MRLVKIAETTILSREKIQVRSVEDILFSWADLTLIAFSQAKWGGGGTKTPPIYVGLIQQRKPGRFEMHRYPSSQSEYTHLAGVLEGRL